MKVQTNKVWNHLESFNKRFIVEQGGTRSGKTYNILIWLIFAYCSRNSNKVITICRKTFPALRGSVLRDFIDIMKTAGLYDEEYHNKSEHTYLLNGNLIEFISIDQPTKVRGRKRAVVFVNEANELTWEDFFQLNIRTDEFLILDFNPSDEFHWIYDRILNRNDAELHVTTYKDNPFLSRALVDEIELLENTDADYWLVYGLGQRGRSRDLIYQYKEIDKIPDGASLLGYGMDWGFTNAPTVLVAIYIQGINIYIKELIYRHGLHNHEIDALMKDANVSKYDTIVADNEDPKSISELFNFGWNIVKSTKGADSVVFGIDLMKRHVLHTTSDSLNIIKEFRNYKWKKDKDGRLINEPVKLFDHGLDATRGAIQHFLSNTGEFYVY